MRSSIKSKTRPPNIVFFMTDQQRHDALGCANPVVKTPNLDRLAARGIRYDQAVCNVPMCVPSRYSMMLGLYGSQCGVRHNTQFIPRDSELPHAPLPERLRLAGYQTAGFGKTHWWPGAVWPELELEPSARGFEVRAIARSEKYGEWEPGCLLMGDDNPEGYEKLEKETEPFGGGQENHLGYIGCTSQVDVKDHWEGWLTDQALKFLDEGRDPERPLFLYLSFDAPHAGYNVPKKYEDMYDLADIPDRQIPEWDQRPPSHSHSVDGHKEKLWREMSGEERRRTTLRYYAKCSFVDDMFGRVVDRLDAMGELDNTMFVFLADHGEMLGDRRHDFSKYCLYEGSVRVPLILAGPLVPEEKRGTVDSRYAELVDVLPTFLDMAGQPIPPELAGGSLLQAPCRLGGFAEMHGSGYEQHQVAPAYMWRTREWKLILKVNGSIADAVLRIDEPIGELYNLETDPQEWRNLYDAPEHLAVRERLTRELLLHLACAWAKAPHHPTKARI